MWKIDLTLQQEKRLKDQYFKAIWQKFQNEDNCLDLKDSYRFLQELMQKGQGKPIESDKAGISAKKQPESLKKLVASDIKVKEDQQVDDTVSMFDQDQDADYAQ